MTYLIDTNVLLNGLFNPYSPSRKVLVGIEERRIDACVSAYVIDEARTAVQRVQAKTGVILAPTLVAFLASRAIRIIVDSGEVSDSRLQIINAKDRPVLATAMHDNLKVCTNDIEDYGKARALGLTVISPAELSHGGVIGLHTVFRLSLMNPKRGAVYVKFYPQWTGVEFSRNATERFCIFDQVGMGCLYYRASTSSFQFDGDGIPSVSLKVGVVNAPEVRLVFSYDDTEGVRLVYGGSGIIAEDRGKWRGEGMQFGNVFQTHDRHGLNQLCGTIPIMSSFPAALSVKGARRVIQELTVPDAEERFSLEDLALHFYR